MKLPVTRMSISYAMIVILVISLLSPISFAQEKQKEVVLQKKEIKSQGSFGKVSMITKERSNQEKQPLRDAFEGSATNVNIVGVIAVDTALVTSATTNINTNKIVDHPSDYIENTNTTLILPFIDLTNTTEICDDGIDNDGAGQIDCADPQCATFTQSDFVSDDIPSTMNCLESTQVTITVNNTGCQSWDPIDPIVLQRQNDSNLFVPSDPPLPQITSNGETIDFTFTLTSGSTQGSYISGWQMANNSNPFGARLERPIDLVAAPTEICNDGIDNDCNGFSDCADPACSTFIDATYVTNTIPGTQDCSNSSSASITFNNTGCADWTTSYLLNYLADTPQFTGADNQSNPSVVAPGELGTFFFTLDSNGLPIQGYTLDFRMNDGTLDFGDLFSTPFILPNNCNDSGNGTFDSTPPTNVTVWDDGNWTNNETSLHARWYAFDRESKVFYAYQIFDETDNRCIYPIDADNATCFAYSNNSSYWVNAPHFGQAEEVTVTNGTRINDTANVTLELDEAHNYTFRVMAINSWYIFDQDEMGESDGIITDFTHPNNVTIDKPDSSDNDSWVNASTVTFEWSEPTDPNVGPEEESGVKGYSYVLTADINEMPDTVVDGNPQDLLEEINHTYSNMGDGIFYFRIRAEDNARNWGDTRTYIFKNDITRPGPPQIDQSEYEVDATSLTISWIGAQDGMGSGIDHYDIEIFNTSDNTFYTNVSTADNATTETLTLTEGDYDINIYAVDQVGWISDSSGLLGGLIDTTPPTIEFIKPDGLIVSQEPKVEVHTNEDATCYITNLGNTVFEFTGTAIHAHRVFLPPNSLDIMCEDRVRNSVSASVPVTVDTAETVTSFSITNLPSIYAGQTASIEVTTTPRLGELPKEFFEVIINNNTINDIIVRDRADGVYELDFVAPFTADTYDLSVKINGLEENNTLNVNQLNFGISYSSNLDETPSAHITWKNETDYVVGVASDSAETTTLADGVTSSAVDGFTYMIITKPTTNPTNRERFLDNQDFDDLFNPSFGSTINRDSFQINSEISYEDIKIMGNNRLPGGKYNVIIKNKGIDPDTGKTIVEIEVV